MVSPCAWASYRTGEVPFEWTMGMHARISLEYDQKAQLFKTTAEITADQ